ncbi:MAG: M20 family metallopeptidase [Planctomycetota bacterium]|nr:M20 family metallopeptidase [Planctomycetota bacterium]
MTTTSVEIKKTIAGHADELKALAMKIHRNPELGFEEKKACAWQVQMLKRWGFKVQTPFAGLSTAYKAVFGRGKPVFCLMAEYDALPEIGHACGHNLICTAAMGAGAALRAMLKRDKIAGTLVVMGAPAEESKGGKIKMLANGALKGIDAVMMAHPSWRTTPDTGCTAIQRIDVTFEGVSAHAAASPEKARNALDAIMLLFHGVSAWRQQLPETSRVHGIVVEGGVAPNIIPDLASCRFFLRSPDEDVFTDMAERFRDIARGAALMTGTKAKISPGLEPYRGRRPNKPFNEAFIESAEAAGLNPVIPEQSGRGSSDFGDVSCVVPGSHVYFGIAGREIPAHSVAFRKAAGSAYGLKQMLRTAEAMAQVGYRYFSDDAFRKSVHDDFRKHTKR